MAIISGHGTTLAFGTVTTFTPLYTTIGGFAATRESLDTSSLSTTGSRTKVGGDLFDVGAFTSSFFFEPALTGSGESNEIEKLLFDPDETGTVRGSITATIAFNDPTAAVQKISGSSHLTGFAIEDMTTNSLVVANITVQWDDWPAFADAAAS